MNNCSFFYSTEKYFDYINTPLVIFIKTEFMKVIFIALHCRICTLGSTVLPSIEEYIVFVFFLAVMLSEYEQWRTSKREIRNTVYFKYVKLKKDSPFQTI